MPTQEQLIKKDIKEYISKIGGFWSMIQGGPYSKPGDPDMLCCINGLFVGIEVKTPTGVVSELQEIRGQEIKDAGGIWFVARSLEDVKNEFERRSLVQDGIR